MAEEDSIFDPTLKKKKKKKKTTFDIDAALAEGTVPDSNENTDQQTTDKENQEPPRGENETKEAEIDDGNLDLENFGKKKKKKKKPFNMEELDGALPDSSNKSKEDVNMEVDGNQDEALVEVKEFRTVHEFYDAGQFPTCAKISEALRDKIGYSGSGESTRRLLRSLGFSFKKCNNGHKFLMERSDIIAARIAFLRKMHSLRVNKETRPIVYLDEMWVNQNHTKSFIWQDKNHCGGLKVPLGKGGCLIVCHAGSAKFGFISGAKLVFRSGSNNNDYHSEMIKTPSSNTRKAEIEKWLEEKFIPHDNSKTRNELLALVRLHKQKYRTYELDKISAELGHEVIRLPPYHCQYNPAELIWAQVKKEVANENTYFRLSNVEQLGLLHEALDKVSVDNWRKCVQHAERLQEEDFLKEGLRDNVLESIIVTLTDSSESDGSADTDEEEEAEREDGIEAMV
ncbi:hypothetical protein ANN_01216 [Periplaneta americana]|uniref:Transposase n=1 Tax=Periplaneta americana TaxID=6978 RepID=A0ABQ8TVZ7_PERAM|nr:hypothetical protein ANN_01216 [Periplaneta americana]